MAPFSAQVQDRVEGAVDILRGFPPIHAQADRGHERLVLAEAQLTQRNLAKLWKNVCANVRQGRTRSARLSIRKYFVSPLLDEGSDCFSTSGC